MSISEAYSKIDQQFDSFCDASNNTSQSITLTGNTYVMTDNCQQTFVNKATVRANCEMDDITENVAQFLSTTNLGREIADKDTCADASASECTATLTESIKTKLRSACSSHNDATQSFTMTNSVIMCDSNTDSVWGNEMDVRASCLKQKVLDAQTVIENRGNDDDDGTTWLGLGLVVALCCCCCLVVLLFVVIASTPKKIKVHPNKP